METRSLSHYANVAAYCTRSLWLILVFSLSVPAFAQHHMMGGGIMGMGGYMGPVVRFSSVDGSPAAFVGGRAGMMVRLDSTNSMTIGGAMYGMMTDIAVPESVVSNLPRYLSVGYGGVELGYVLSPNALLSFTLSSLLGMGWSDCHDDDGYDSRDDRSSFLVAEPGVGLTLNATPFLRIGLEASYRFAGAAASRDLRDVQMGGLAGGVTLQIGHHR